MPRTLSPALPSSARQLAAFGDRLRLARLRRRITATLMAQRAGLSRDTLYRVEKGDPAVSLGTYLRVLRILGLDADLDRIAADDLLGRKLQDLALEPASRGRK